MQFFQLTQLDGNNVGAWGDVVPAKLDVDPVFAIGNRGVGHPELPSRVLLNLVRNLIAVRVDQGQLKLAVSGICQKFLVILN